MWLFPAFTTLGSFFLLFSFLLELFIIIGQISNRHFLRKIFYARAWNNQGQSYNLGLWNYCTVDGNGDATSCAHPYAAYNWAQTPNIVDTVPNLANSGYIKSLFLGLFILLFIGLGFSFILWLMSLPICCLKRRGWGYSMSTLTFINFLVTLVALILALILVLAGIKNLTSGASPWQAHAGNALWLHIGAVVSLLLAFFFYSGGSCFGRKGSDNRHYDVEDNRGWFSRRRRKNRSQVSPVYSNDKDNQYKYENYHSNYNNTHVPLDTDRGNQSTYMTTSGVQPITTTATTTSPSSYGQNANTSNNITGQRNTDVLQQPYMMSPNLERQRTPTGGISNTLDNNHVQSHYTNYNQQPTHLTTGDSSVPHDQNDSSIRPGYQTPVLQSANIIQ
ncbi:SUR7/PalI family-domain-containing protein [Cokeromyces recurvatus]|uniref:SUR7/PalI family-domain-containing protein n=1 Tax=Cokeromyces recurvatus TaxID=90255 RepID=UPI00221EA971|nr:SUR7/PalI family-domain-containing protein [Cokeromyces recurvatus]KAI7899706.1 SUR7/PalI family-domain-containing protein [Cokeromyces recurvatus]